MHALILAGGRGTRLRPLTDTTPKPLLPFMGAPFAVGLLRRLSAVGAARATFLVGQDPAPWDVLAPHAREVGIAVDVVTEPEPLDTAGAARRLLAGGDAGADEPVLVLNGDICTDLDLAALVGAHRAAGATATLALTRVGDTSAFGVVVCAQDGRVERFVEKPAPGTLDADTINAGTYVLAPDAFARFPGDGPLSFERVVFPGLVESGAVVLGAAAEAYWQDLGTPQRYLDGHRDVLDGRCRWPLDPRMVVDGRTAVHRDADVSAEAVLDEWVVVGPGCAVGPGVVVRRAVLHDGAEVGAGARITDAVLASGTKVEPGAVAEGVVTGAGERVSRA